MRRLPVRATALIHKQRQIPVGLNPGQVMMHGRPDRGPRAVGSTVAFKRSKQPFLIRAYATKVERLCERVLGWKVVEQGTVADATARQDVRGRRLLEPQLREGR
jgi:hypothetical protein